MDVNDIFIPMRILTNYDEYKKILKKSENKLKNVNSLNERNIIQNECKNEIRNWHHKMIIKSVIILIIFVIFFIYSIFHFKLSYYEYLISFLIIGYIISFILEKYRNKDGIIDEINNYASKIHFIEWEDIKIF